MSYDWSLTEEDWTKYIEQYSDENCASGDYIGCCRIGELCFDIVVRKSEEDEPPILAYNVYLGGVDDGYGYSAADAMAQKGYKSKYDVPDEEMYPYTECGYGDFETSCTDLSLPMFRKKAEREFDTFLLQASNEITKAAMMPLHIF